MPKAGCGDLAFRYSHTWPFVENNLSKSYNAAFPPAIFVEGTTNPQTLLSALGGSSRKAPAADPVPRLSSAS